MPEPEIGMPELKMNMLHLAENGQKKINEFGHINKPNLFILGAARCGTTTLQYLLSQHPDVFMTSIKEPMFFSEHYQNVENSYYVAARDPAQYLHLYDGASRYAFRGEASHAYLTSPSTHQVLKAFVPDAKFLVILRNPVDRAYSLYNHMRRYGLEKTESFEKALSIEDQRYESNTFREACPDYVWNYYYYRSGLFGMQLKRYYDLFPSGQIHVLTVDEIKRTPQDAMVKIFNFLGIRAFDSLDFRIQNEGVGTTKHALLQYLFRKSIHGSSRGDKYVRRALDRFNMKKIPLIKPDTRAALKCKYVDDSKLLKTLTGISFC